MPSIIRFLAAQTPTGARIASPPEESLVSMAVGIVVLLAPFVLALTGERLRPDYLLAGIGNTVLLAVTFFGLAANSQVDLLFLFERMTQPGSPATLVICLLTPGWLGLWTLSRCWRTANRLQEDYGFVIGGTGREDKALPGAGWKIACVATVIFALAAAIAIVTVEPSRFTWIVRALSFLAAVSIVYSSHVMARTSLRLSLVLIAASRAGLADVFFKLHGRDRELARVCRRRLFTSDRDWLWVNRLNHYSPEIRKQADQTLRAFIPRALDQSATNLKVEGEPELVERVALALVDLVAEAMSFLRWHAASALAGCILLLAAANLYPLQPHRALVIFVFTLIALVSVATVLSISSINRDRLAAAIVRRPQGRAALDWSLAARAAPIIVLLVANILATQFPVEIGRYHDVLEGLIRPLQ